MDGPSWLHYSVTLCVQSWTAESPQSPTLLLGSAAGSGVGTQNCFYTLGLGSRDWGLGLRVYRDDYV